MKNHLQFLKASRDLSASVPLNSLKDALNEEEKAKLLQIEVNASVPNVDSQISEWVFYIDHEENTVSMFANFPKQQETNSKDKLIHDLNNLLSRLMFQAEAVSSLDKELASDLENTINCMSQLLRKKSA